METNCSRVIFSFEGFFFMCFPSSLSMAGAVLCFQTTVCLCCFLRRPESGMTRSFYTKTKEKKWVLKTKREESVVVSIFAHDFSYILVAISYFEFQSINCILVAFCSQFIILCFYFDIAYHIIISLLPYLLFFLFK